VVEYGMLSGPSDKGALTPAGVAGAWPVLCDPTLDFATPQLRKLHAVWQGKRGERAMPARSDFSLRDLSFALPHVAFLSVVREDGRVRFKVRLEGSEIDAHTGPMTGKFIDEAVPKKFSDKWSGPWLQSIETLAARRTVGRVEFRERSYYISESLCAPLASDGETPDGLLLGVYYHLSDGDPSSAGAVASKLASDLDAAEV
jgi:hypothetical protein